MYNSQICFIYLNITKKMGSIFFLLKLNVGFLSLSQIYEKNNNNLSKIEQKYATNLKSTLKITQKCKNTLFLSVRFFDKI